MKHVAYLRRRLYAPAPIIIWFLLVFCALTFLGWPFNITGFLGLIALYLWVAWAA